MEYTPIDVVTAVPHPAAGRASAYGLDEIVIDGNDPDAVYLAARDALRTARDGRGPTLIEALTYRSGGHSRADPGNYRPPEEVGAWAERDPLPMYTARLLSLGVAEDRLEAIEDEAAESIDSATHVAMGGDEPGEASLLTDVFADGGASWRN